MRRGGRMRSTEVEDKKTVPGCLRTIRRETNTNFHLAQWSRRKAQRRERKLPTEISARCPVLHRTQACRSMLSMSVGCLCGAGARRRISRLRVKKALLHACLCLEAHFNFNVNASSAAAPLRLRPPVPSCHAPHPRRRVTEAASPTCPRLPSRTAGPADQMPCFSLVSPAPRSFRRADSGSDGLGWWRRDSRA